MSHGNGEQNGNDSRADFAKVLPFTPLHMHTSNNLQAWKEIQEGEQQASMMERNLTALEKKIDDLLAAAESQEQESKTQKASEADSAARAVGEDKSESEK